MEINFCPSLHVSYFLPTKQVLRERSRAINAFQKDVDTTKPPIQGQYFIVIWLCIHEGAQSPSLAEMC